MEFVGTTETFSFNELEVKGVKEYFISGYISTKSIDKFNDLITDECLEDMTNQINNNSIKIDYEHETIHSNNLSINPIARIVEAKKDDKGVWVKAVMNPSNNKFNEIWSSIKQGFLDSFSIAFKPIEAVTRYISGKAIRVLNKLKLINVGITGTPVNDDCKLDNVIVKALDTIEYLPLDDLSDEELELKHKYIKRTGSTGNYKYFYREDEQRDSKSPKGNPYKEGSQAYKDFEKGQETSKKIDSAKTRKDKMKAYLQGTYTKDSMESVANNYGKKFDELSEEELEDILKEHGETEALKEFGSKEKQQSPEKPKESNEDKLKKEGFIIDEDEARRKAFQEAKEKGKLFNLNTWKKKREEERVRILEKKALNTQSGLLGKPEDHTSHSTSKEEDNNTMANEEKPKDEKLNEDEVDTKNEDAELEDASEDKSDKIEEKSNDEDEDDVETKGVIDALTSEVKSLKSQLAELKEKLSEPEFKALQQPITKLKENVTTPLSLIG